MVMEKEIDKGLLQKIDELQLSKRLSRWKEVLLDAQWKICTDRSRLAMESWKETEGEDIEIRRAKLLEKILGGVPIAIYDWDLVVGRETEHVLGTNPRFDISGDYIETFHKEEEVRVGGIVATGALTEEERDVLRECGRYFAGKTAPDRVEKSWHSVVGSWHSDFEEVRGQNPSIRVCVWPGLHNKLLYEDVLEKGLIDIMKKAKAGIQRFKKMQETDANKFYFWQAVLLDCKAVINYAHRYAKLAREMAEAEPNAQRRNELEEIAKVCEWVPENPARTLHEAIQSVVFLRIAVALEHPHHYSALGRFDQYLWPYFKKDIGEGRITLERAAELVGGLIAHWGSHLSVEANIYSEYNQAFAALGQANVGGVNKDGEDASNELSYLILHMLGLLKIPEPHVTFRWHPRTPRWLLLKAIETNSRVRGGIPQFENDVHAIEHWTEFGVPLEDARDWWGYGCSTPDPTNKIDCGGDAGLGNLNVALSLDLTLHNGIAPVTGKLIGLETGDPRTFKTFEDFLQAFKKQHEFIVKRLMWLGYLAQEVQKQCARLPFLSCMLPGCLEKGKDVVFVDSDYILSFQDRAVVDTADSLTAVKKLVFDEKRVTMGELLDALDSNFKGKQGEEIRQMCLEAPKFGNDIDEADWMVRDVGSFSGRLLRSQRPPNGAQVFIVRSGLAWHYWGGQGIGALPNGRKSGEPLNDGSISPMRGMDKFGPTAVLRSVLKAGLKESSMTVLNQKFSGTIMQSPESREKLALLTDTFLRNGGQHVQYNIVDNQMLRDAKEHPEKYRDLVVRVGGFSTYFVQLAPEVQDDIIARSEQVL